MRKNKHRSFTLIELLVVASIIALLISILLPALNTARETGKRIACATKLKQLGAGSAMYINDNEDYLCPARWSHDPVINYSDVRWYRYNTGILQYVMTNLDTRKLLVNTDYTPKNFLHCPSDPNHESAVTNGQEKFSYGYTQMAGDSVFWQYDAWKGKKINKIKHPTTGLQFSDMNTNIRSGQTDPHIRAHQARIHFDMGKPYLMGQSGIDPYVSYRHRSGLNVCHFDGSVSYETIKQFWSIDMEKLMGFKNQ